MAEKSKVSIVKTQSNPNYEEIRQAVQRSISLIGGINDIIRPGNLVLINPSWVAPPVEREAGCITLPEVTQAIADIVTEMGAELLSQSPQPSASTRKKSSRRVAMASCDEKDITSLI